MAVSPPWRTTHEAFNQLSCVCVFVIGGVLRNQSWVANCLLVETGKWMAATNILTRFLKPWRMLIQLPASVMLLLYSRYDLRHRYWCSRLLSKICPRKGPKGYQNCRWELLQSRLWRIYWRNQVSFHLLMLLSFKFYNNKRYVIL